jgi:23S rRNA pseudouridine1911/1915/1917 synthase
MYGGKFVYPWQLANAPSAIEEAIVARPALHAFRLEFKHPTTNKIMMFEAPLPDDMNKMLELLRKFRKI